MIYMKRPKIMKIIANNENINVTGNFGKSLNTANFVKQGYGAMKPMTFDTDS